MHFAHDAAADVGQRVAALGLVDHQGLLAVVGEAALGDEADGDLIPLVNAAGLNEAVQLGPLVDHAGHHGDDAVEQGGLVGGIRGILALQIF